MPTEIRVRVKTDAKNESVIEIDTKSLQIAVKEKPEGNTANHRVIELVARHYRCPVKNVRLMRGHTMPLKHFEVHL